MSVADLMASNIVHAEAGALPKGHPPVSNEDRTKAVDSNPPPECPMHKKLPDKGEKPVLVSECPVVQDNSDINPLNMVNKSFPIKLVKQP